MKIEDEIKQGKFLSEYHKMLVNLIYTSNWINLMSMQFLAAHGVSPQQFNLLRILRGHHPEPSTISMIQDRMLDKSSNASRLVEKLREKDLVRRTECSHDRRQVDVCITDRGLALLSEIDAISPAFEDRFRILSEEEARELNRLLDKLRDCKNP